VVLILAGVATGCNRLPESYTATVAVNTPGESSLEPTLVRVAFKRSAMRVDFDGGPLPGYALAWQSKPEVFVMMPGREIAYRWNVKGVAERYGTPQVGEMLVLPFTASPWMIGARKLGDGEAVDGQPTDLWAKLTDRYLYRIWVHKTWAIPVRFETLKPEGQLLARYEFRDVKPDPGLSDDLFNVPAGVPAPAIPPGLP